MDYPKLRYIEAHPYEHEGKNMVLLRDAEGIIESSLLVPKEALYIISLMDGTRSSRDIQADYMRASGTLVYIEQIEQLIEVMDKNLFLANDNFNNHHVQLRTAYENNPVRKPCLAGKSYPDNRMELLMALDEILKINAGTTPEDTIAGILAPHIDYMRGAEVYSKTYNYLRQLKETDKTLIVVLGTSHHPTEKIWSISLKDFSTPLDIVPNSQEFCRLVKENSMLKHYVDEWPHRSEHSIELQLPLMQFTIQNRFDIFPVLTGSMQSYVDGSKNIETDQELADIVGNFKLVLEKFGGPHMIAAGADLAHIGEQFGDSYRLDITTLEESKSKDEELLEHIANVDADSFFGAIRQEGDRRRICGLTPIYFQLKLLEGSTCKIADYKQWTDGKSSVSFAGGLFYNKK
jgi:hypothetical protein